MVTKHPRCFSYRLCGKKPDWSLRIIVLVLKLIQLIFSLKLLMHLA